MKNSFILLIKLFKNSTTKLLFCPGLGFAGDIVKIKKKIARNHMLPTGAGLYVTPENIAKTEHLRKVYKCC